MYFIQMTCSLLFRCPCGSNCSMDEFDVVAKAMTKQFFWHKKKEARLRECVLLKNAVTCHSSSTSVHLYNTQSSSTFPRTFVNEMYHFDNFGSKGGVCTATHPVSLISFPSPPVDPPFVPPLPSSPFPSCDDKSRVHISLSLQRTISSSLYHSKRFRIE
jgi:hypothetical protein